MKNYNVFVISRRAWQQDDLDYGSFEIIFITTKEHFAISRFRELKAISSRSADGDTFKCSENEFEYCKGDWFYQYKLEGFMQDVLNLPNRRLVS